MSIFKDKEGQLKREIMFRFNKNNQIHLSIINSFLVNLKMDYVGVR